MHQSDVFTDDLVDPGGIAVAGGRHGNAFQRFETGQHGGADSAEGRGHAVEGQTDDRGAQGREAEAQQQRRGKGGRRAEARGPSMKAANMKPMMMVCTRRSGLIFFMPA